MFLAFCFQISWLVFFVTHFALGFEVKALNPTVVFHILSLDSKSTALCAGLQLKLAAIQVRNNILVFHYSNTPVILAFKLLIIKY